jgi:hypothetical protein
MLAELLVANTNIECPMNCYDKIKSGSEEPVRAIELNQTEKCVKCWIRYCAQQVITKKYG